MAVVTRKTDALANADASPVVPSYSHQANGMVRVSGGVINKAADDSDGSDYRIARIPSNARILARTINAAALTGFTSAKFGFSEINDGAVVDNDVLETLSLASATRVTGPFASIGGAEAEKRVWELLGLSEDPSKEYDLVLTANTAGSAAGDIAVDVFWVV